jgi:nucleoside-diphosphate-sugar epimerase
MRFEGTRVLVSGGAGFVGSNLVRQLAREGAREIVIVDNLLSAERWNVPEAPGVTFVEGSIADTDQLRQWLEPRVVFDYVFHLSTYHGNQSSIHDPIADHDNNLVTTLRLFDRLARLPGSLKKVVYSAAGCAVAEKVDGNAAATEETNLVSLRMDSPYSISKVVGEFYAVYYYDRHRLPVVRARFQNVYGPGEILGAGRWRGTPATVWRNVTPTFVYRALNRQGLTLENEGRGSRDFIYVDDIVEGLIACALKGLAGDVYNLATGVETTVRELASEINQLTNNDAATILLPKRDWDRSGNRYGSPEKAARELGFSARTSLRDGLQKTIAWTREHKGAIDRCVLKHRNHMPAGSLDFLGHGASIAAVSPLATRDVAT